MPHDLKLSPNRSRGVRESSSLCKRNVTETRRSADDGNLSAKAQSEVNCAA